MSVREFIGARYVPIFVGEWDKTRTYEPLMVVTYQGASYTSRQYVPAGIEITNESYWVLSANYNAQVEAYRKEVRDILPYDDAPTKGSTKGVTSDGIKKAIDTAEQTNAKAIANEVTRAKAAEQTNAKAITEVSAKNSVMVVIGDSWSSPENGYVKWHDKVAKNLGMTVDNFAVGGSGFINNAGNTFSDQLDRVHAKYANNPNAIGRIYVQGFVNDLPSDATTLMNAYRAFDTKFASYFPNKGYRFVNASLFPTTTAAQINTMNKILADMQLSNSCSLIDAIGCVTPANLKSDGRHPANEGYKQLGNTVCGSNYLYVCKASEYFTNEFSKPIYSDAVTITKEDFAATNEPIAWTINFKVKTDNVSKVEDFVNWSSNPLLNYFIHKGYTNSFPIFKTNGACVGRMYAASYTQYAAVFSTPVQTSDNLIVDLSQAFK